MANAAAVDLDLVDRLRFSVARLARTLRQQDVGDLSPTTAATLATIAREGPLTLGELAAHEQVAPPTITKVAGRLEAAGLIDRIRDPDDRRVFRVALSRAGERHVAAVRRRRNAWLAERLRALEPDERARVLDAVEVLERLVGREP